MFEPPKPKAKLTPGTTVTQPGVTPPRPLKANDQEWRRWYKGESGGVSFLLVLHRLPTGELRARYQTTPGDPAGWHLDGQLREDNTFALKGNQNEAVFEGTVPAHDYGSLAVTRFENGGFELAGLYLQRTDPPPLKPATAPSPQTPQTQASGSGTSTPSALKTGQEWERWYSVDHQGLKLHVNIHRLKTGKLTGRYQAGAGTLWELEGELRQDGTFVLRGMQNSAQFEGNISAQGPITLERFKRGAFEVENLKLERSAAPGNLSGSEPTPDAPDESASHDPAGQLELLSGAEKRRIVQQRDWGAPIGSLDGVSAYYNDGDGSRGNERRDQRHYSADKKYEYGLKWQCVEYIRRYYYDRLGIGFKPRSGNAQNYFKRGLKDGAINNERSLKQYNNGGIEKPAYQDIIVMGPNVFSDVGHVAIVAAVSGNRITIAQQNVGTLFTQDLPLVTREKEGKATYRIGGSAERLNTLGWMRR